MSGARKSGPLVVLTGASNVTKGLGEIVATSGARIDGPVRFAGAIGLGRSYGLDSTVMGRELPPILRCGLWDHVEAWRTRHPDEPGYALIADVGNDIAYGVPAEVILRWVEEALARYLAWDLRVVITGLPLGSLGRLPRWRFELVRRVLFPTWPIDYDDAFARIHEVERGLAALAAKTGVAHVELPVEWYGADPIHIRRASRREAWRRILDGWGVEETLPTARLGTWSYLLRPSRWARLGEERRTPQPVRRLRDGSSIWLY